jgi:hypothetical protein
MSDNMFSELREHLQNVFSENMFAENVVTVRRLVRATPEPSYSILH